MTNMEGGAKRASVPWTRRYPPVSRTFFPDEGPSLLPRSEPLQRSLQLYDAALTMLAAPPGIAYVPPTRPVVRLIEVTSGGAGEPLAIPPAT